MNEEVKSFEFTVSSGNIFADMELEDADELLIRAKLGYAVRKILENRNLEQQDIADLLNIKKQEVSNLLKGKYHLFPMLEMLEDEALYQAMLETKNETPMSREEAIKMIEAE